MQIKRGDIRLIGIEENICRFRYGGCSFVLMIVEDCCWFRCVIMIVNVFIMEIICYQGFENIVFKENFEREKMVVKFKKEKDLEKKKKKRKKEEEGGDLFKLKKMKDGLEGGDRFKKVKVKKEKTEKEKKLQKEFEFV